jgi:alpha-1,3-glucan synthase
MLHQFKAAIKEALDSKPNIRREMRARSAKQRFPVAQWVQSLERLQSQAIAIHEKEHKGRRSKSGSSIRPMSSYSTLSLPYDLASGAPSPSNSPPRSRRVSAAGPFLVPGENQSHNRTPSPMRRVEPPPPTSGLGRSLSLGVRNGPGSVRGRGRRAGAAAGENRPVSTIQEYDDEESSENDDQSINEFYISVEEAEFARTRVIMDDALNPVSTRPESRPDSRRSSTSGGHPDSPPQDAETGLLDAPRPTSTLLSPGLYSQKRNSSALSLDLVVGDKKDYQLQHVDPTFNDTKGEYYHEFESMLASLDAKNSDNDLAIETFLEKSEKEWHKRFLAARLSRGRGDSVDHDRRSSIYLGRKGDRSSSVTQGFEKDDEFEVLLGRNYKRPTGLRRILQYRVGDWPLYSLLLALGQIVAASAYQITLISGVVGLDKERFYITVSIYLATSILWWLMFRTVKSVYVLSLPFLFYGLAFLTLALAPVFHNMTSRMWLVNVATGSYAIASSSGSLFFSLNFGDEGGSPIKSWVFRCCVIQGTQQIYVCVLWFFGDYLSKLTSQGRHNIGIINNASFGTTTAILAPIAVVFFSVGLILLFGLPNYYRQAPGKVPSFYISLFRRKTVIWFFVTVIIQNYFLSEPYGRNWQYLFASNHATTWEIVLLIFFFFIFIWGFLLFIFGQLSKTHSWILPIFGIGLGAPRWAQILWSCSNIGMYVPWVGSPLASALVGRSLWLWLGVLDALQGVGFGMILLQTLTRIHMAATLIALQIIGAVITMVAQATQQNAVGTTFPDFSAGVLPGLAQPWFWVGLTMQLVICVGFFTFFRKEQLSKP